MQLIEIKHRFKNTILFSGKARSIGEALEACAEKGISLSYAYLADINASGIDACCLDLRHADISRSIFSNSRLEGIKLGHAMAHSTDFEGSSLCFSELVSANLTNANLAGANLFAAYCDHVILTTANLIRTNASEGSFCYSNFDGTIMVDTNLTGSDLTGSSICGIVTTGAKAYRTCFKKAMISDVSFKKCNFHSSSFDGSTLSDVGFTSCSLKRSSFLGANLKGIKFIETDISHSDFSYSIVSKLSVSGVKIVSVFFEKVKMNGAIFSNVTGDELAFLDTDLSGLALKEWCYLENTKLTDSSYSEVKYDGKFILADKKTIVSASVASSRKLTDIRVKLLEASHKK